MSEIVTPAPGAAVIPSATAAPIPVANAIVTPPAAAGATPPEWTSGFDADLMGYVQTKGFTGPKDVAMSLKNAEKLIGVPQDRVLKLPENLDTPEGRAIFERLGTPKEAKEYKIEIPKEHGDETFGPWAAEQFHKLGVPKKMAEGFVQAWVERTNGSIKTAQDAMAMNVNNAVQALQKEWGAAYEQNKAIVDAAARTIGMTEQEVNALSMALGPEKAAKYMYKLGTATGEHAFVSGQSAGNGVMAPAQAQAQIKSLIDDPGFRNKLLSGDAEAKNQWANLHKMAAPGEMSFV